MMSLVKRIMHAEGDSVKLKNECAKMIYDHVVTIVDMLSTHNTEMRKRDAKAAKKA
jgi:hypothetical protein